jgi:1-deoxy-D-xylulose-5-phosphate reductoisomerase
MGQPEIQRKRLAVLGSTGSIGRQTLDVVRNHPELFEVEVLTARNNLDMLVSQAVEFSPNVVIIANSSLHDRLTRALSGYPIKVYSGSDAIYQIMEMETIDLVVSALVGYAGLKPTLRAVEKGKVVALANKETMVVAGDLITRIAMQTGARLIPVDSEHSAIFQCLQGESLNSVEKIVLTASGGPFRGKSLEYLRKATKQDALRHPRWSMGNKITIDSASLMNKGLEVIEARWLFDIEPGRIEVVIHPQSIIHSLVHFIDGSVKAQMGLPDMRLPILYAMTYPRRIVSGLPGFSFNEHPVLTFEEPDHKLFPNLGLAYDALRQGGNMPCILNAANESAVHGFLEDRIGFVQMTGVIEHCMSSVSFEASPDYDSLVESHKESFARAEEYIINHK